MILARILEPRSKLATARSLHSETLTHTLGEEFGIENAGGDELYRAMDWLLRRQRRVERHLAKKHLQDGAPGPLRHHLGPLRGLEVPAGQARLLPRRQAQQGPDRLRALCYREGCPVAVEVFAGNTADPGTLGAQLKELRERFSLSRVVHVGDRGFLTDARIREEVRRAGRNGSPRYGLRRSANWWTAPTCSSRSSTRWRRRAARQTTPTLERRGPGSI